jgi:hypothetical protein
MKTHLHGAALVLCLTASILTGRAAPGNPDEAVAKIDQLIAEQLEAKALKPNPVTTDEVFVRRLYLDLIGRIPTKKETTTFLESTAPGKRADLVDTLIGSDGYVSHHYNYFADLLRARTNLSGNGQSVPAGMAYEHWIKSAIRSNKPYNDLVYELVTASGATWENGAVGYTIRDYGMPLDNLAMTSQVFLGTQIVCAQCHNHPFDAMTQMDYYHLAAFTYGMVGTNNHPILQQSLSMLENRKGKKVNANQEKDLKKAASEVLFPLRFNNVNISPRPLRLPTDYKYDDANPLAVVTASTLFGNEAVLSESTPPVIAFGEWLTSPENPRFTKVIANRLWKRAFGLGLIEPVDDIKENTVATNAPLMDYLEDLLVSLDYDLRAYQRILYRTDAYQREASLAEPVPGEPYYFAGPILRRMSAEQIWDSLVAMTVTDPDAPDASRVLAAEKRLATVELIAESVYDQKPAQFLKNLQQVVKIQEQLSLEIEAAQGKVAQAREAGDPSLIREATAEAKRIRDQLANRIEETVYRDGLSRKLAANAPDDEVEKASVGPKADAKKARPESAGSNALMADLATAILTEDRSFDQAMDEIVGTEVGGGIISDLIDTMFVEKERVISQEEARRQAREITEWKVKTKEDRGFYKTYNRSFRSRMQRASELPSPAPAGHFLREFGQSDRELIENANDHAAVTQSLALLNGSTLSAITSRYAVLTRDMRGEKFDDRLDTIYLTMLSRLPTAEEKAVFKEAWAADPESGSVTGIVWTVLNTRQFLFIQ